jgi:hypothetical protein
MVVVVSVAYTIIVSISHFHLNIYAIMKYSPFNSYGKRVIKRQYKRRPSKSFTIMPFYDEHEGERKKRGKARVLKEMRAQGKDLKKLETIMVFR